MAAGNALMSDTRYRIMFILTPPFDPNTGGVQMSTWKIATYLLKQGHSVGVFSFSTEGHRRLEGCHFYSAPRPGGTASHQNMQALAQRVRYVKPDVVINQMPYEHQIGKLLRHNQRYLLIGCLRNTLFSVRGDLPGYVARTVPGPLRHLAWWKPVQRAFLAFHRRRHRAELETMLGTYDKFVMFGAPNLKELAWFVPQFDRNKVTLIPNSIPEVAEVPPSKDKRLLWLGRVAHDQKRAELILPIWKQVSQALPDWELDVVGDGPLLEELQHQSGKMRLPRINFHGLQVPDDFYRRAAIFFMTSAFEGFPNTLVEAQSHGAIPVIFDSYPVASWLVQDGVAGALVPPFDTDAMADQIIELAESPDRERFAVQALESARRFHIDRVGQLWQELFESEVSKHVPQQVLGPAA